VEGCLKHTCDCECSTRFQIKRKWAQFIRGQTVANRKWV